MKGNDQRTWTDIWMWKSLLKFKLQQSSLTFLMRNLLFAAESISVWDLYVVNRFFF